MNGHRLFPALKVGGGHRIRLTGQLRNLVFKIEDRGRRIEDRRRDPRSSIFNLQIGKAN